MTMTPRPISNKTLFRIRTRQRLGMKISQKNRYIFEELAPGDIAIDCGANVGLITEQMVRTGATVHAFEPNPHAFEKLNQKLGEKENVFLHENAVADKASNMRLFYREEHAQDPVVYSVGSTLIAEKTDIDQSLYADVDVICFADFLQQFEYVRMIKIDIEGAEIQVLNDLLAKDLLKRVGLVLVETHETWIPGQVAEIRAVKQELKARGLTNVFLNWV